MDLGIKDRRALILGGSRGIGRAVAAALAAEGVHVAVCARKAWAARKVASEAARTHGVEAAGYGIDAWDEPSMIHLVSYITNDCGPVDMLFGIARRPVLDERHSLSSDDWRSQLDNGFLGLKAATEVLLKGMLHRQWGRILWMIPYQNAATSLERRLHSVTTSALAAWLTSVATETATDKVTLNLLMPGSVARITGTTASPVRHPPQQGFLPAPTDEALSVQKVAAVATFLLSHAASGISGETVRLGVGTIH